MKRSTLSLTLVCLLIALAPAAVFANARPIESFGADGDGVPQIVRDFLNEDFFTRPVTEALASGLNYVASVEVPRLHGQVGDRDRQPARRIDLGLRIANASGRVASVVVSAAGDGGATARNFIVHLAPGEAATVDAGALARAENVYLLSLLPFTAQLDARLDGIEQGTAALAVLPPADPGVEGGAPLKVPCISLGRTVEVCNTSGCVTARASRSVTVPGPYETPEGTATIQYPIGTNFHCPNGVSYLEDYNCTGPGYATHRCDSTPYTHYWYGLDDTILYCYESEACCTSGCSGCFTVNCS